MDAENSMHLLERLGVLSHPCDLDLLLFFFKHPNCLLRSETLAAFLGYEAKVMADSLDSLLGAGLLTRAQTPAHAARLYALAASADTHEWLPTIVKAASTRPGRLALRQALAGGTSKARGPASGAETSRPGPRRLPERNSEDRRSHTG